MSATKQWYYVWDEKDAEEGYGGVRVEATSEQEAIQFFHDSILNEPISDENEYHASIEKPEWWDNEEPGAEVAT